MDIEKPVRKSSNKSGKKTDKKHICLALQGGGSYGAFTWGVLDKFLEDGRLIIDAISATSAGSINAVILADGMHKGGNEEARQALSKFWNTLSHYGTIFNPVREFLCNTLPNIDFIDHLYFLSLEAITRLYSPYQLNPLNFNPLRSLLIDRIDFDALKTDSTIKLFLCATNVESGKLRIFKNKDVSVDAVLASACLPNLYQAVRISEQHYWDGGFLGNPPIFPLIYHSGVNDIIIIHNNPIVRNDIPMESAEIVNRVNEISFNSSLIRELRVIAFVTSLIDQKKIKEEHLTKIQRKFIHMVRADEVMKEFTLPGKFNWHGNSIDELYQAGRKVGADWLTEHFDDINKKSTLDFNEFIDAEDFIL